MYICIHIYRFYYLKKRTVIRKYAVGICLRLRIHPSIPLWTMGCSFNGPFHIISYKIQTSYSLLLSKYRFTNSLLILEFTLEPASINLCGWYVHLLYAMLSSSHFAHISTTHITFCQITIQGTHFPTRWLGKDLLCNFFVSNKKCDLRTPWTLYGVE